MKNYYVLSNGRVRREANTVYVENKEGEKKPLPVEDVDSLYLFGEVDLNTRLLNFLSQKKIPLHVFNYYGFYSGSYYPREYLHSGFLLVHQVACYHDGARRLGVARELVRASAHSLLRNLAYYERRKARPGDTDDARDTGDAGDVIEPPGEHGAPPSGSSSPPTDAETEVAVDAHLFAPADSTDSVEAATVYFAAEAPDDSRTSARTDDPPSLTPIAAQPSARPPWPGCAPPSRVWPG